MPNLRSLGIGPLAHLAGSPASQEWVVKHEPLRRILRFTGRSIDDIVNSPIAKNEVIGYYKLQKMVSRRMEIVELEEQWNGVA